MKISHHIIGACLSLFVVAAAGAANDIPKNFPAFLNAGSTYRFCLAVSGDNPSVFAKIIDFDSNGWIRVQPMIDPDAPRPIGAKPPEVQAVGSESWLNFGLIGAAIPADPSPATLPLTTRPDQNPGGFPKIGARYFFGHGLSSLPYFAKVLETVEGGWFRVQELPFGLNPSPGTRKQWWINSAFVSRLTEAKPEDAPE